MRKEADQGSVVSKPEAARVVQSSRNKPKPESPKSPAPKLDNLFDNMALTAEEIETFVQAICDLAELLDTGLWHVGLDTDPSVPDREGNPGVPIWQMTQREAKKVADSFVVLGKHRPELYKAIRAVNQSHAHLQAGLIVGSRFVQTGMRFFEVGFNFRASKFAWAKSINRLVKDVAAE